MNEIIGVAFAPNNTIYYCEIGKNNLKKDITVIVETDRGLQFGTVVTESKRIDKKNLPNPLYKIIRISNKKDYHNYRKNEKEALIALKKGRELSEKKNMKMQIIDANYNLDRSQLMFRFVADNRVDFRELAKELAAIYKTRIELRQIGIRDKAKEVGGMGLCGQSMCCARFLKDFTSVSISMAKNQNISLNPNKINGVCGRLLCCLKYEDECYSKCKKNLPKEGTNIETKYGNGKVVSVDILNRKYIVDIPNYGLVEFLKEEDGTDSLLTSE